MEFQSTHKSVHSLIRTLKSPSDPPNPGGPTKIDLASQSWSDLSFCAANKAEIIVEWLLDSLGRDARRDEKDGKSTTQRPIADPKYWSLLQDILASSTSVSSSRPLKGWLVPLLFRVNLAGIVEKLLTLQEDCNDLVAIYAFARAALTVIWPLAEKRVGMDALVECLSAVLCACAGWTTSANDAYQDDLASICSTVVGSYSNALSNFGNKKKLYTTFLSAHLPLWIDVLSQSTQSGSASSIPTALHEALYTAGIDTLFSLEAVKQPFDIFLEAFSRASSNRGLTIFPRLFAARLATVNRYRTTLFPTGSTSSALATREAVRADAIAAWESSWKVLLHDALLGDEHRIKQRHEQSGERKVNAWSTLVGTLDVIEKERLFVASQHTQLALVEVKQKALLVTERACQIDVSDDNYLSVVSWAINALDILVKIEYDLVGDVLGRMLGAIVRFSPLLSSRVKDAAQNILSDLLEFHTNTRTIHTYTLALLTSISLPTDSSRTKHTSPPNSIPSALLEHLPSLSQALRIALTPTQCKTLGPAILDELKRTWNTYSIEAASDSHIDKKQKFTNDGGAPNGSHRLSAFAAIGFAHAARMAGRVLSSLPPQAYIADPQELNNFWNDAGKFGWEVVWACLNRMRANREEIPSLVITDRDEGKNKAKRRRDQELEGGQESGHGYVQADSIVASAALRFLYDIRARLLRTAALARPITLGDNDSLDEGQVEQLLGIVKDGDTSPELVLEIILTLFSQLTRMCGHQGSLAGDVIQASVKVLVHHFTPTSRWCGSSSTLSRESLSIALLYIFVDRWMDLLDALAPTKVLQEFVSLLLSVQLEPLSGSADQLDEQKKSECDITARGVLLRVLRGAQFWELHNFRGVLLSSVLTITAPLSLYALLSSPPAHTTISSDVELDRASEIYSLLMHAPPEYFTRPSRTELVKRAVGGDLGVCAVLRGTDTTDGKKRKKRTVKDTDETPQKSHAECDVGMVADLDSSSAVPTERWMSHLIIFRSFLLKTGHAVDHTTSRAYIVHLFNSASNLPITSDALIRVTVDLVTLHLTALLREQGSEATASAASVITMLVEANPFSIDLSQHSQKRDHREAIVYRLIDFLRDEVLPGSLAEAVVSSLKTLYDSLASALPAAEHASSKGVNIRSSVLSLAQWLGVDVQASVNPIGMELSGALVRNVSHNYSSTTAADMEMGSSVLGLLFQELRCMPVISYTSQLDMIAALYSMYDSGTDVRHILDAQVGTAVKKLSVKEFSYLLEVVAEGIESPSLRIGQCQSLIHLSTILLHDAPPGTLKVVQVFVTRCLNAFTRQPHLSEGLSEVKADYLELIAVHCADRPAALRAIDLGSIWSLLSKILLASSTHDGTTSFTIFHHIASITSSLVRLRRDLVIYTLPHLASILHRLVAITRAMRPQLGGKQSKLVSGTFPSWITPTQPLGVTECRTLSRLLTALTTKTVPRTHIQSTSVSETQKAESLAKPFAKHVGHVLMAYIDAMNDPLCLMSPDLRRELQPGLFSLCEMLGEHSRDALVASTLDSGGKAVMKVLWKEYEKQRYVGKG